ncbi:MAG: serine--tRNA ligase [Bacteriovoracaceae bacterium]|nr:serine--tRNA ligase [Bacteriovoracaceae bacterium]
MLDIKLIEQEQSKVVSNLSRRNFDVSIIDKILDLNKNRKDLTTKVENIKAELNRLSKEIGVLKKAGKDASDIMAKVAEQKSLSEQGAQDLEKIQIEQNDLLSRIPNLVADDVPVGKSEAENKEIFKWGQPTQLAFKPLDHADLGEKLGMLDFEKAAQITGARFAVYKKDLARLERALSNFMLDFHVARGYQETMVPFMVHERALYGTGNLPKFKDDLFKIEGRDWYLIPTSEVPLTNLKREEIFEFSEFPLSYASLTPCFRSEAGSYGKDTKGLIRMHQFNKVEMVNITPPEKSEEVHESMITSASDILKELNLPHRGVLLCSGDMGFGSRKTVDLEVWLPSQNTYREISSVSNCWDFQARRAGIRFRRDKQSKPEFAHTLNGSGLAVGRTLVAILENFQQADGSVAIPEKLWPYMNGVKVIKAH